MRRRTYRSAQPQPRRRKAIARAIAIRPVVSLPIIFLLGLALLLALVLPRLAGAAEMPPHAGRILVAPPAVEIGAGVARIHLETAIDAPVLIEWGLAPNASRAIRSSAGTVHDLALQGLEPGRVYVYRVLVGGKVVTPATPFRTAGAVPARAASLSI